MHEPGDGIVCIVGVLAIGLIIVAVMSFAGMLPGVGIIAWIGLIPLALLAAAVAFMASRAD